MSSTAGRETRASPTRPEDTLALIGGGIVGRQDGSSMAIRTQCEICSKQFTLAKNLYKHIRTYHPDATFDCDNCNKRFTDVGEYTKHLQTEHQGPKCNICDRTFKNEASLRSHKQIHKKYPASNLRQTKLYDLPGEDPRRTPEFENMTGETKRVYKENWENIRTHYRLGLVQDKYNFRFESYGQSALLDFLRKVFEKQKYQFKLNLAFGFILNKRGTSELMYYYPSNNTRFLPEPILIGNKKDLKKVTDTVEKHDPEEFVRQMRPSTQWINPIITNVTFYVEKIVSYPIGQGMTLPPYIMDNPAIHALVKDKQGNRPYLDNKCFFRCLALHKGAELKALEKKTNALVKMWGKGEAVYLEQLRELEEAFNVNIHVYELGSDKDKKMATLVARPTGDKDSELYLNLYEGHFSYIKDLNLYTKGWRCSQCDKLFDQSWTYHRHESKCVKKVKKKFAGGGIGEFSHQTLFDRIEQIGIEVQNDLKFFPFRIAFDFETMFQPCDKNNGPKLSYEQILIAASVSVASNVPGYEKAKWFVSTGDSRQIVVDMYNYMVKISESSYSILTEEVYCDLIDDLKRRIYPKGRTAAKAKKLLEELENWLKAVPVVGFNSGRFDLNVIRTELVTYLVKNNIEITNIIKRGNTYMHFGTNELLFLDIVNFVAAGTSYEKWIKIWGVEESKGFFPYEKFTSLEYLDQKEIPAKEDFYSSLRNESMSDENYEIVRETWDRHGFKNIRELLVYYNNLDVEPMIIAAGKMCELFKNLGIDMLKEGAISLPGIAYIYLLKTMPKGIHIPMWGKEQAEWHDKIRSNIVGGPSIVWRRHAKKGVSYIRNGQKKVQKILGYDANAEYLYSLMQEMPTQAMAEWARQEDGTFKRTCASRVKEIEWVEWKGKQLGYSVKHAYNGGQKKIGSHNVDGFIEELGVVLQFHGCRWHGHGCHLDKTKSVEARELTEEATKEIRKQGYTVVEKWECEFEKEKKENADLRNFIAENYALPWKKNNMTKEELINYIKNDKLFGLVECTIRVPEHMKEKFKEMTPIFKNVDVGIDDIGDHMKEFAVKNGLMKQPRRCLIGSYFGEKILLITPLVKWYLNEGLEITEIFGAMEFKGQRCLQHLGDAVTENRSAADADPNKAMLGELFKLLGNSFYGKATTNIAKHTNVKYCGAGKVGRMVNNWKFRSMEELDENTFEVEMAKGTLNFKLPEVIGFYVYQYAKMVMLDFYFNFLKKYLKWDSFEMLEMDTDSAYFAFAYEKIDEGIKDGISNGDWEAAKRKYLVVDKKDKRTPGLFKEEWSGTEMLCLNSKTYLGVGDSEKRSTKGLSKRTNNITMGDFMNVLLNQTKCSGVNKGFRMLDKNMTKYTQIKDAIGYLYIKRKVMADGITTEPLSI